MTAKSDKLGQELQVIRRSNMEPKDYLYDVSLTPFLHLTKSQKAALEEENQLTQANAYVMDYTIPGSRKKFKRNKLVHPDVSTYY